MTAPASLQATLRITANTLVRGQQLVAAAANLLVALGTLGFGEGLTAVPNVVGVSVGAQTEPAEVHGVVLHRARCDVADVNLCLDSFARDASQISNYFVCH